MTTELVSKDQTVSRVVTVVVLFVVLAFLNSNLAGTLPRIVRQFQDEWTRPSFLIAPREENLGPEPESSPKESKAGPEEILDKLRELSRLASGGNDYTLTADERTAWEQQHPCESRRELPAMYAARKHVKDLSSNPAWERVLDEYSNLHRICMKRVGNITHHFLTSPGVSIPGCKFLVGEGTNGLGNKFLVTVSAVLYAIATQRILVMPPRTNLKPLLCEPFIGSSWMLETEDLWPGNPNSSWVEDNVFIQNMYTRLASLNQDAVREAKYNASQTLPPLVDAVIVSSGWAQWQPHEWFYCATEQTFLSEVPWVYMSGCLYSAPKIVGSPMFRASLQTLFPDNMVLTRLLRSTLLPGDAAWSRFKHLNHAYFQQADRRVAIQLRFYNGNHDTLGALVNERIIDCVVRNGILPNVSTDSAVVPESSDESAPITNVFIASLYPDLHDRLSEFYLRNPTESGEDVSLVQVSTRMQQSVGVEEDTEALVEVLLLSVSDALLVTPFSTFGGLAHGYGGLTPWFINTVNLTSTEPCQRGAAVDECQQDVGEYYNCPNDPRPAPREDWKQDGAEAEQEPPTLGQCVVFGFHTGAQVLGSELPD